MELKRNGVSRGERERSRRRDQGAGIVVVKIVYSMYLCQSWCNIERLKIPVAFKLNLLNVLISIKWMNQKFINGGT